ncbi:comEC family competence protein [bacterium BMS3Abin15]|nr:comEC family competence protein [bacterium BMS3Abin15]HDH07795.1 ComEC family competence protein [Candidatus Moranbacteria bacterium]HDZ85935.1 ComEC family competence protein [Candidatus Moranbacteria bacterium]
MQLTKSKIFLILSLGFMAGIFLASFFNISSMLIYFFLILAIIILILGYRNRIALVIGFVILFFILGAWRFNVDFKKLDNLNLNGNNISEKVIVVKEPENKGNYQKLIVRTDNDFKILVNAGLYPEVNYGDELDLNCALEVPENFSEDFDYRMYLAKDKIYYLCKSAKIEKTENNKGNKIYLAILKTKNGMEENVNRVIPQPQAALANGLLFGGSSRLSEKVSDNFSKTGMTHIVAVSGYNVTIIAEYLILFGIFIGLWRKQSFWFALIGIFLFVAMIGFPSSAVRAGVMGTLLLWAMKNGRLANSHNAIIFAGAIMLLINPLLLRWDIGFQLSFLATLGIIMLAPLWEKVFIKKHKALGLTEILFLTISAQIFVLPIILYNFKILSLVSIPANMLVLLIVPITMLLVFLTAISGFVFGPLSLVFAWLAFLPLKYEVWIINTLADLSWASKSVENFHWLWVMIWYLALATIIFVIRKRNTIIYVK